MDTSWEDEQKKQKSGKALLFANKENQTDPNQSLTVLNYPPVTQIYSINIKYIFCLWKDYSAGKFME